VNASGGTLLSIRGSHDGDVERSVLGCCNPAKRDSNRRGSEPRPRRGSLFRAVSLSPLDFHSPCGHPTGCRNDRPEERYYLRESIFCLPLTLVWMALFAVMVRRASARAGGTGTFEADLTVLAFTQTAPMIVLFWVPDMACYLLGVPEDRYLRLVPVYGSAATAWALALSTAGIATTERISWRTALPTVVASEIASVLGSGVAVAMR
jgi:hypothetical protein